MVGGRGGHEEVGVDADVGGAKENFPVEGRLGGVLLVRGNFQQAKELLLKFQHWHYLLYL